MSVTLDIVATYRAPRTVMARILGRGQREDRALAALLVACLIIFVAQWPYLARQAHLNGTELNADLAGALMAWVAIAPLLFYALGGLTHLLARAFGGKGSFFGARMALFWALLAASPLVLLHGLTRGFLGSGPQEQMIGALWFGVFLWFWLSGLWQSETG